MAIGESAEFTGLLNKLTNTYNESIATGQNIQWYVDVHNPNDYDYTDYNGQELKFWINL